LKGLPIIAKKALFRKLGAKNDDPELAEMESIIFEKVKISAPALWVSAGYAPLSAFT
jgi:hypothetical protein